MSRLLDNGGVITVQSYMPHHLRRIVIAAAQMVSKYCTCDLRLTNTIDIKRGTVHFDPLGVAALPLDLPWLLTVLKSER